MENCYIGIFGCWKLLVSLGGKEVRDTLCLERELVFAGLLVKARYTSSYSPIFKRSKNRKTK